jgi:hypothetical protein
VGLRLVGDKELGARLRSAREWAGTKGRELSRVIGEYEEFVSKIETGRVQSIGIETLKLIARELAGRGRLRDVDEETLVQFLQGEIGMDDSIRPTSAAVPAPTAADSTSFAPRTAHKLDAEVGVEELRNYRAPAETGAPERRDPDTPGDSPRCRSKTTAPSRRKTLLSRWIHHHVRTTRRFTSRR